MRSPIPALLLLLAAATASAASQPPVDWTALARGAPRDAHRAAVLVAKVRVEGGRGEPGYPRTRLLLVCRKRAVGVGAAIVQGRRRTDACPHPSQCLVSHPRCPPFPPSPQADPRAAFDAWAAAFGKVYNDLEVRESGGWRQEGAGAGAPAHCCHTRQRGARAQARRACHACRALWCSLSCDDWCAVCGRGRGQGEEGEGWREGGAEMSSSPRATRSADDTHLSLPPQYAERRFAAWLDNLDYVHTYNAQSTTHWVSVCWGGR